MKKLTTPTTAYENIHFFYANDNLGSVTWVTNSAGNAIQHIQYLPFGEIFINQETTARRFENDFKFLGKELDSETGYTKTDNRYYWAEAGVFLSVDPLAEARAWISPYNYSQNNPVGRSDKSGMLDDVVVTGAAAEKYVSQLQTKNLKIIRNESTGRLSYDGKARTRTEKQMAAAIDSKDVTVNICAENSNSGEYNGERFNHSGGGLIATEYTQYVNGEEHVNSYQHVNPITLEKIGRDTGVGVGMFSRHELTEPYEAGMISLNNKSSYPLEKIKSIYNQAHTRASFAYDLIKVPQRSFRVERSALGFPIVIPTTEMKFQIDPKYK